MSTLYPNQISYWQIGCNDAKAGRPSNPALRKENGYEQGFYFGQHGKGMPVDEYWLDGPYNGVEPQPDPPLKNPYMEAIEAIEGILTRMNTFHKEFPASLKRRDEYLIGLLRARDELHALRLDEVVDDELA